MIIIRIDPVDPLHFRSLLHGHSRPPGMTLRNPFGDTVRNTVGTAEAVDMAMPAMTVMERGDRRRADGRWTAEDMRTEEEVMVGEATPGDSGHRIALHATPRGSQNSGECFGSICRGHPSLIPHLC